jgi:hypothetical protein
MQVEPAAAGTCAEPTAGSMRPGAEPGSSRTMTFETKICLFSFLNLAGLLLD